MFRPPRFAPLSAQSGHLPLIGAVFGILFAGIFIVIVNISAQRQLDPAAGLAQTAAAENTEYIGDQSSTLVQANSQIDQLSFELAQGLWESQRLLKSLTTDSAASAGSTARKAQVWVGHSPEFDPVDEFASPQFGTLPETGGLQVAVSTAQKLIDQVDANNQLLDHAARSLSAADLVPATLPDEFDRYAADPRVILAQAEQSADALSNAGPGSKLEAGEGEDPTALALTSALGQLDQLIGDLTEDKRRVQIELTSARLAQRNAELKAEQSGEQLDAAQQALLSLEEEFQNVAVERGNLQRQISELEANEQRLAEQLDQANTQLAEAQIEIERMSALDSILVMEDFENAGQEQLAKATRENVQLLAEVAQLRALLLQSAEANKLTQDTLPSDPAYQAALAVGVQAALVEERAKFDDSVRELEGALAQARAELDLMDDELASSLGHQRFAEAEYSRALAETERLRVELERRAELVGSARDIQSELLQRLNMRYAAILRGEQNSLTSINPALLDALPKTSPLWDELDSLGRDLGGQTAMALEEVDEFSMPAAEPFELDTQMALASDAVEFAISLDQNLSTLESLRELWHGLPLGSPVEYERVSSNFGPRLNPVTGRYGAHNGIDLAAATGTAIYVQNAGTVVFAGWRGGFGRFVEVDHGNGVKTRYAHLRRIAVREGQTLVKSDKLGEVGTSGRSTGPHLHYEILVRGNWVDPRQWIKAR